MDRTIMIARRKVMTGLEYYSGDQLVGVGEGEGGRGEAIWSILLLSPEC